jgi:hypothetical protein
MHKLNGLCELTETGWNRQTNSIPIELAIYDQSCEITEPFPAVDADQSIPLRSAGFLDTAFDRSRT